MTATAELPVRFPCWVQAIYSWGGETKRDLGFIEGDLIECLNAGDGSWWMGRLRRDRRIVGLFPSNFVRVLNDDFRPTPPRNTSPMVNGMNTDSGNTSRSGSLSVANSPNATPQKNKSIFRKPFSGYSSTGPDGMVKETKTPSPAPVEPKSRRPKPYSSMKLAQSTPPKAAEVSRNKREPSPPRIPDPVPRARSPLPGSNQGSLSKRRPASPLQHRSSDSMSQPRQASPLPQRSHGSIMSMRSASPLPLRSSNSIQRSRPASPLPQSIPTSQSSLYQSYAPYNYEHEEELHYEHDGYAERQDSPPPPPPPAHRVAYTRPSTPKQELEPDAPQHRTSYSEQPLQHYAGRTPSPAPSDQRSGYTPSPLRDAMNDVMNSLEVMGVSRNASLVSKNNVVEDNEPAPLNVWSPDAYDDLYPTQKQLPPRPHTMFGSYGTEEQHVDRSSHGRLYDQGYADESDVQGSNGDRLDNFVQRMDSRLNRLRDDQNTRCYQYDSSPDTSFQQEREQFSVGQVNMRRGSSYGEDDMAPPPKPPHTHALRAQKSAFELGEERLNRTYTTKSSVTTASSAAHSTSTSHSRSTQATSQSGFSATSAGSLARRRFDGSGSIKERPVSMLEADRTGSSISSVSYHASHASQNSAQIGSEAVFQSFATPSEKKRGFFRKMLDGAKTSAASARSSIHSGTPSRPSSRSGNVFGDGVTSIAGPYQGSSQAAKDMGLGGSGGDWVQMRRDVNRANSLSRIERSDRIERCELMDFTVLRPVEEFSSTVQGDESADGYPITDPSDFASANLALVDKSARFVNNVPAMTNAISLAQGYLCRPYRSDVQRLRAIFTWVAERVTWEDDFEGEIDTRRVIQTKRGCSEEIACLVAEMCNAIGLQSEIVRGYLKCPSDNLTTQDLGEVAAHPNHWWNTVLADGEWRIMDCALANPSNPKRSQFSSASGQVAESWWFLTRPTEICYTHVPLLPEQQHIVPSLAHHILMALPVASPPYFKNHVQMWDFDTSLLHLDGLEMAQIQLTVPENVECIAEVEARTFATDPDGDFFESGDVVKKRALAQGEFVVATANENGAMAGQAPVAPFKRYTIKALLPTTNTTKTDNVSNTGTLKIYAGKRGLMHSINNNPHSLALSLPLRHQGINPEYEFFTRHPTPHALRQELYVLGPLCKRLVLNSTFVFTVRQHAASTAPGGAEGKRPGSPNPSGFGVGRPTSAMSTGRPGSAMSMASISISGSNYSNSSNGSSEQGSTDGSKQQKPTKLAIQSPSGKILRMTRKTDASQHHSSNSYRRRTQAVKADDNDVTRAGSAWETIIKIGERGMWRGLVLADRSARWCVFGEWECL